MIEVVPPRKGVSMYGVWRGPIPQEKEGPIGPGIWVMRGEDGTPVMYRPHMAMIKVVNPPDDGYITMGSGGGQSPRRKRVRLAQENGWCVARLVPL